MWQHLLDLLSPSVCPGCEARREAGQALLCSRCRDGIRPCWEQAGVLTAVAYEATGARLIRRFKFDARGDALSVLVEALAQRLEQLEFDAVVPIPRHPDRIRSHGSDPAFQLARRLSRRIGRPIWEPLCRIGPGRPQTGLSQPERRKNVDLGFQLSTSESLRAPGDLLLVDDVTTTGATLASAKQLLLDFTGARSVVCAALAATPGGRTAVAAPLAAAAERSSEGRLPLPSRPIAAL